MKTIGERLNPCVKCGGQAAQYAQLNHGSMFIQCKNCGQRVIPNSYRDSEDLIMAWNEANPI